MHAHVLIKITLTPCAVALVQQMVLPLQQTKGRP